MKTTSRTRIARIATVVAALLVVISAMGLAFAEETPQAPVEETPQASMQQASPQATVQATPQPSVQEASQAAPEETPQVHVEITPTAPKPYDQGQRTPMVAKIASVLNMEVEDVITARHEGKSFVEIAAEKGISESQLVDALIGERKAFLDSRVTQGKLTPQQAEAAISKMEETLKLALGRREVGPPDTGPDISQNIGHKDMSRTHALRGRAGSGKHGFMKGFSQGFQAGRRAGLRQGLGFGKGQGQDRGKGICPFCGQACPFYGQTQEPAD